MVLDYKVKTLRRLFGPHAFFRLTPLPRRGGGGGASRDGGSRRGGGGSGGGSGGEEIREPTAYLRAAAKPKVTKGGNGVPRAYFENQPPRLLKGKTVGKQLFTVHLLEKQKMRVYYGAMRDGMFRRYVERAQRQRFNSDAALLRALEMRLDTVLYRSGVVESAMQARQWVSHGHILVNGERVTRRSTALGAGDVVSVADHYHAQGLAAAQRAAAFREAVGMGAGWIHGDGKSAAGWLEADPVGLGVALLRPPSDDECRAMRRAALLPYIRDAALDPHSAMRAYR